MLSSWSVEELILIFSKSKWPIILYLIQTVQLRPIIEVWYILQYERIDQLGWLMWRLPFRKIIHGSIECLKDEGSIAKRSYPTSYHQETTPQ